MSNNIDLADIKAFVTIANSESFTKAANVLNVSRGHLSRQLKKLEEELKVELLIRTTRSLKLTAEGKDFFEKCRHSLNEIDLAVSNILDKSRALQGDIRINSVGGIIGEDIISAILTDFSSHYPQINISLDFSSVRVDLIKDQFDLVVRMGELDDSSFIARKLTDISFETLASPAYLKQNRKLEHPKDLKNHNCLTGSIKKWSFIHKEKNNEYDLTVDGGFSCKNGRVLIDSALKGVGIIRVPTIYCEREIKGKLLVPVFSDWTIKTVPFYLLYHTSANQPERLKVLIDYFLKNFSFEK